MNCCSNVSLVILSRLSSFNWIVSSVTPIKNLFKNKQSKWCPKILSKKEFIILMMDDGVEIVIFVLEA